MSGPLQFVKSNALQLMARLIETFLLSFVVMVSADEHHGL